MPRKKILAVDDEDRLTHMIKLVLERTGEYEVREENKGANALEAAREFQPDLILLDVMMPDISGDEVAAQLREDELLKNTKYIFLTAIVTKEETSSTGSDIAGHTFLAKPVKTTDLIACIEEALK